jgi:hypothetical protein
MRKRELFWNRVLAIVIMAILNIVAFKYIPNLDILSYFVGLAICGIYNGLIAESKDENETDRP